LRSYTQTYTSKKTTCETSVSLKLKTQQVLPTPYRTSHFVHSMSSAAITSTEQYHYYSASIILFNTCSLSTPYFK